MAAPPVVTGQKVDPAKIERAKALRRSMTATEQMPWRHLRRDGLLCGFQFRRQQVIGGFIVDFYCHRAALVVKVDGEIHQDEQQREYNTQRDHVLNSHGLRVLRIPHAAVEHNLPGVLALVKRHLAISLPPVPLCLREEVGDEVHPPFPHGKGATG